MIKKKEMKIILVSFIILTIASCDKTSKKEFQDHHKTNSQKEKKVPQLEVPTITNYQQTILDSVKQQLLDTTNIQTSPVKIISAILLTTAYSDHKDIQLIYKNVSKNNIKGIKFEWYCENAFGKPASGKSFYIKGQSTGTTTSLLQKQRTVSEIWEDFSTDADTIITVRAYEVIFSNGMKWKLRH